MNRIIGWLIGSGLVSRKEKVVHHYYYRHPRIGRGRATIAYRVTNKQGNVLTLLVGRAFCSPKDAFSRKEGRALAEERCWEEIVLYHDGHDSRVPLQALLVNANLPAWAGR